MSNVISCRHLCDFTNYNITIWSLPKKIRTLHDTFMLSSNNKYYLFPERFLMFLFCFFLRCTCLLSAVYLLFFHGQQRISPVSRCKKKKKKRSNYTIIVNFLNAASYFLLNPRLKRRSKILYE